MSKNLSVIFKAYDRRGRTVHEMHMPHATLAMVIAHIHLLSVAKREKNSGSYVRLTMDLAYPVVEGK